MMFEQAFVAHAEKNSVQAATEKHTYGETVLKPSANISHWFSH